jgi:DNA end-binding protein Ku
MDVTLTLAVLFLLAAALYSSVGHAGASGYLAAMAFVGIAPTIEQLVLIRPYENGLIMHGLFYANEVRDFGQIPKSENVKLSEQELTLGANLIEEMSDEFDPDKYRDEYRIRVLAMLEEKSKGRGDHRCASAGTPPRPGDRSDAGAKAELGESQADKKIWFRSKEEKDSLLKKHRMRGKH